MDYERRELEFIQMERKINQISITISQMKEAISNANHKLIDIQINRRESQDRISKNLIHSIEILKNKIKDWEYKYLLKSTIGGTVSFQEYWAKNQNVKSGDIIFSILPKNNKELVGKLTVPSNNSGKLLPNQKVIIKLNNYPY
ncbi:HlyD family secretion protein, partial [Robertkochia marina]